MTNYRFWINAPSSAEGVKVRIYPSVDAVEPEREFWLNSIANDYWEREEEGDFIGKFYTFEVYPDNKWFGLGETPGVFATAVGINGRRCAIIDMSSTNPEGWDADHHPQIESPSDLVVYELHYRDFSAHPDCGYVYKGKYLSLTEPKALDYLKSLGVGAVQIMPSFDFATVDERYPEWTEYNWGYDPINYNVPDGSYSTDAWNPATRIRELKQMVMALHSAGIRVIMDVVYNHCYNIPESNFQRIYPDYYFRKYTDENGKTVYSNGSGCGNETASERPLMRQFMIESVWYWAAEYHIDGFRFDLMGVHDMETMRQIRCKLDGLDPSITMYGEGWSGGPCTLDESLRATKEHVKDMPGIGAFGNEMRDAIRGPFDNDSQPGWLSGAEGFSESIKFGIVGAIPHPDINMQEVNYCDDPWTIEPWQHVSYVSCHDDMCLYDRLAASFPDADAKTIVRLAKLALTPVLLSQGIPFLFAGEEVLRSKKGVRNAYKSPDRVNQIDWENLNRYPDYFHYVEGLIHMRRRHKAFRMGSAEEVRKNLHFIDNEDNLILFRLNGEAVGDEWKTIYVIINPNSQQKEFTLPEGRYKVVCENGAVNPDGFTTILGGKLTIGNRQTLICVDTL